MVDAAAPVRARNPRGSGAQLREEILSGAGQILDETGRVDAVTLRAIARRIAIAAPSIYAHFPDLDAILTAMVEEGFDELRAAIHTAADGAADPVQRLRLTCHAYFEFAAHRP